MKFIKALAEITRVISRYLSSRFYFFQNQIIPPKNVGTRIVIVSPGTIKFYKGATTEKPTQGKNNITSSSSKYYIMT